jgi:hypothetical protein
MRLVFQKKFLALDFHIYLLMKFHIINVIRKQEVSKTKKLMFQETVINL